MNELILHHQETETSPADLLTLLDQIPPASEEILPPDVCLEIYQEIAQQEVESVLADINTPEPTSDVPETFAEMLDTAQGNFLQRATKAWIKPHDPEGTIKLLEQLQVHKFQAIPIKSMRLLVKMMGITEVPQSNYTLGKPNLNSMIDFATNQSTLNEVIHLAMLGLLSLSTIVEVANGRIDSTLLINMGAFAANTYLALGQRYARAKLNISINRALARKKNFNIQEYKNRLGLKFPSNSS